MQTKCKRRRLLGSFCLIFFLANLNVSNRQLEIGHWSEDSGYFFQFYFSLISSSKTV